MLGRLSNAARMMKPAGSRGMAGHAHSGPPPTGIEAVIRSKLPEDYQIVMATLGIYTVLSAPLWWPSSKKPEAKVEAVAPSSGSSVIPSIIDDSFEEWAKVAGNLAKWEESLNTIGQ
ncbi:hypothetical protein THRCLA_20072 [Thraustotheca clavata]|uniref:Uncharacterized protein n=1 Tax=Thraustotheca clavata TaxID=74557 RepID=A0A1W0AC32_9STRA|nr:hypothetical protein THRCLA_20072 [Thraustotheca clavata]